MSRPNGTDLAGAFGPSAAASLRDLLPRRSREEPVPVPVPEPAPPVEPDDLAASEPAAEPPALPVPGPRRPVRTTAPRPSNRRWGVARMTSREHVELLVLVVLRGGPADGREIVGRLHDASDGGLAAPLGGVYRALHHLVRRRLVEREDLGGRPRYRLTESGSRITRSREREWDALRRTTDAVLRTHPST